MSNPTFAMDHGKTVIWKVFVLGYEDDETYYCSTQEIALLLVTRLEQENPNEIIKWWAEEVLTTIDDVNNLKT